MNNTQSLGQRIKATRKKYGLTQILFAKKMGVCKGAIINYEKDTRSPDAHFLIRLVKQFNIRSEWLLLGSGTMDPKNIRLGQLEFPLDDDLLKMIEHFRIPTIKLAMMAEYEQLKMIFKPLIQEYENTKKRSDHPEDTG
ncbi:MAG: helix-turn-helix domain-containing protein [Candidatus Aminicenantes bacterium]|nr:MAG: helix-turn-helix domain-containing protein [Candidatus Aminicenantes bacterium]